MRPFASEMCGGLMLSLVLNSKHSNSRTPTAVLRKAGTQQCAMNIYNLPREDSNTSKHMRRTPNNTLMSPQP